jgi:hypothetical protein
MHCRSKSTFGTWRNMSLQMSWRASCAAGAFALRASACSPGVTLACRLAPCLLRSHKDAEASSLVAALLLRHSGTADGADASVYEGAPAPSPTRAAAPAPPPAAAKPAAPVTVALPAVPARSAAGRVEAGGPPLRLPPPLPKATAAAAPAPSELLLPMNKSRSRSGSMEGNAGYAFFKKELKVLFRTLSVLLIDWQYLMSQGCPRLRGA